MKRGKLLVFEGIDGSGKSTQIRRTKEWMLSQVPNLAVLSTQQPGGSKLGAGLRRLLLEETDEELSERAQLLLFMADRVQHIEKVLEPALSNGYCVLCDRYTQSTIAYQGYGRGLSLSLIKGLGKIFADTLEPDLTIWLDADIEVAQGRLAARPDGRDRMENFDLSFHQRVRDGYRQMAKDSDKIVRVDANLSEDEVQRKIQTILLLYSFSVLGARKLMHQV